MSNNCCSLYLFSALTKAHKPPSYTLCLYKGWIGSTLDDKSYGRTTSSVLVEYSCVGMASFIKALQRYCCKAKEVYVGNFKIFLPFIFTCGIVLIKKNVFKFIGQLIQNICLTFKIVRLCQILKYFHSLLVVNLQIFLCT